MPGLRKTSRRSNKDNKNQTRVRKQKKRRTQRQNKRQKRTLKGGSANMKDELNRLKLELAHERQKTKTNLQHFIDLIKARGNSSNHYLIEHFRILLDPSANHNTQMISMQEIKKYIENEYGKK